MTRDLFSLDGKIIAVVGAGSGIGEAIAIGAADQGASYVACLDVNEAGATATAARITAAGGKAGAAVMDIADAKARACLERAACTVHSTASSARRRSTSANQLAYSGD
jgi:NAD(P)-dependent dehydrogenase (short-subunit alcohol dehydrogenase family)